MTRIIIEFEVSQDQIQSVYNFSVHKVLSLNRHCAPCYMYLYFKVIQGEMKHLH